VFSGFSNPDLCQIAANTMHSICTQCQKHMISHLDTLVRIIVSSESINLPSDASQGLLKGAVVILCNLSNMSEISEQLFKLCTIQVEGLQKVINGEIKDGTKALPIYWLDRLTAIFRYITFY